MADPEKPTTPQMDLEAALAGFEAPEHLKTALRKVFEGDPLDYMVARDEDLALIDTVAKNRVLYVLSILKAINYMRTPVVTATAKERQANIALAYIRHAETTNLQNLQMGRAKTDGALESEIETMRQQLDRLVEHKAKAQRANGPTPQTTH